MSEKSYVGLKMDAERHERLKKLAVEMSKKHLGGVSKVSVRAVIDLCVDAKLPELEKFYGLSSQAGASSKRPGSIEGLVLSHDLEALHSSQAASHDAHRRSRGKSGRAKHTVVPQKAK